MNVGFKLLISVLLLASIGVVVGDHLSHTGDLSLSTQSTQIDKCSTDGSLTPAVDHALDEKVFVGSIKSNKYHYPSCSAAQRIKPENEIWFSSSEDARSHGYVPCKICNPP
jgi:hypothetical protein